MTPLAFIVVLCSGIALVAIFMRAVDDEPPYSDDDVID